MSVPVISATIAQQLNQKVQQDIDPHLFLFCNYEPTVSYAISEDARFLTAIQDLYKFGVDSNCILKAYKQLIPQRDFRRFSRLRDLLDIICTLRAVTDHNQSAKNGKIEQTQLEVYDAWIESALHKSTPDTQQDFALLNQALDVIAKELIQLVEEFIKSVKAHPDQAHVVKEWTDRTIHWYSNNTRTEIYKGQLMNAYVANANAAGNDYPDLHRMQSLHRKIGKWIEAALYHPYEKELQELKENISSRENMLNGSNAMFQAFKAKMSPEQLKKFEAGLRQDLAKDKARYTKVMQDRDELETRVGNNHIDYFFRNLEVQLHDTIKRLDSCGQAYTLLPQDLIQEDIENCFGGVPSPEADF